MSLLKQMVLLIVVSVLLAFAGSLVISIWSARSYITEQLERKNNDTAQSFALSMSQQQDKDPIYVELQVSALFDTGYYQKVSVTDTEGKVIAERVQEKADTSAPKWFIGLFPIVARPGMGDISAGWKQFGRVSVVSHSQFAYDALWSQSQRFLLWFAVGGLFVGALGTAILRSIGSSLANVVRQADAIKDRQFITMPEPRPTELKAVTRAMNSMVERVKAMFAEEAARLESMRTKANRDALTGLSSREYFLAHLKEAIGGEQFGPVGSLVLVRTQDVDGLNAKLGRERTDALLKSLAAVLYASGEGYPGQRAGRLKGGEFAVVCPGREDAAAVGQDIHARLVRDFLCDWKNDCPEVFHVAAVPYVRDQSVADLLATADVAMAQALADGPNALHVAHTDSAKLSVGAEQWRDLLLTALDKDQFSLAVFPVVQTTTGALLHEEASARLKLGEALLTAGDFMPVAAKLGMTERIDTLMLDKALARLLESPNDIAVNIAAESVVSFSFRAQALQKLQNSPASCSHLLFETPEYAVFRHFDAFCELAKMFKQCGCRVGIEYFGQRFAESDKLASLGLDYIKVHPSYVRGISENSGNQEFLKGLCGIARKLGIQIIALGVESADDLSLLGDLGFDGATGAAIVR